MSDFPTPEKRSQIARVEKNLSPKFTAATQDRFGPQLSLISPHAIYARRHAPLRSRPQPLSTHNAQARSSSHGFPASRSDSLSRSRPGPHPSTSREQLLRWRSRAPLRAARRSRRLLHQLRIRYPGTTSSYASSRNVSLSVESRSRQESAGALGFRARARSGSSAGSR